MVVIPNPPNPNPPPAAPQKLLAAQRMAEAARYALDVEMAHVFERPACLCGRPFCIGATDETLALTALDKALALAA